MLLLPSLLLILFLIFAVAAAATPVPVARSAASSGDVDGSDRAASRDSDAVITHSRSSPGAAVVAVVESDAKCATDAVTGGRSVDTPESATIGAAGSAMVRDVAPATALGTVTLIKGLALQEVLET